MERESRATRSIKWFIVIPVFVHINLLYAGDMILSIEEEFSIIERYLSAKSNIQKSIQIYIKAGKKKLDMSNLVNNNTKTVTHSRNNILYESYYLCQTYHVTNNS